MMRKKMMMETMMKQMVKILMVKMRTMIVMAIMVAIPYLKVASLYQTLSCSTPLRIYRDAFLPSTAAAGGGGVVLVLVVVVWWWATAAVAVAVWVAGCGLRCRWRLRWW